MGACRFVAPEDVAKIVSLDEPPLGAAELDAIMTLAYLAMIADGVACATELAVFGAIAARVRALATRAVKHSEYRSSAGVAQPRALEDDEMAAVLSRLGATLAERGAAELMSDAASALSPTARRLAYKIAYAMVIVDLADMRDERSMLSDLEQALEIDPAAAADLTEEVLARLTA